MIELYNSASPSTLPEPARDEIFSGPGQVSLFASGTIGGETFDVEIGSPAGNWVPALKSDGTQLVISATGSWVVNMTDPKSKIRVVPDEGGSPSGFVIEASGGR